MTSERLATARGYHALLDQYLDGRVADPEFATRFAAMFQGEASHLPAGLFDPLYEMFHAAEDFDVFDLDLERDTGAAGLRAAARRLFEQLEALEPSLRGS